MRKADKALWMDIEILQKKQRNCRREEAQKVERSGGRLAFFTHVVAWSWNKEMVDALHGWESSHWDIMSSRKRVRRGLNLE